MAGNATLEETDSMLCCSVCLSEFNEDTCVPKLLTCHHSFCLTCLERLNNGIGQITCPTCRRMTISPITGVQTLTTNFYLLGFRDYIAKTYPKQDKRDRIWCKECRDLAAKTCLSHKLLDYDEYFNDLQEKCRSLLHNTMVNNDCLVTMKEEIEAIAGAMEKLSVELKKVAEGNDRNLPLLQRGIVSELDGDADEKDHAVALGQLEELETCLKPFMENTWDVWNAIFGCNASVTVYDVDGVRIGDTLQFDLRRNTDDDPSHENDNEMTALRHLITVIFCKKIARNFQLIHMPNPN